MQVITTADLKAQTRRELADLARNYGVPGWHSMKKDDLVEEIKRVQRRLRRKSATEKASKANSKASSKSRSTNGKARANGKADDAPAASRRTKRSGSTTQLRKSDSARSTTKKKPAASKGKKKTTTKKSSLPVVIRTDWTPSAMPAKQVSPSAPEASSVWENPSTTV